MTFAEIAGQIVDLLEKKTTDYGNSYDRLRTEFGAVSFYIRLFDKLYRLQQVDQHGDHVGEAATDTIRDIVGYCLLELRYRARNTGRP
jgi:hypothetical protein